MKSSSICDTMNVCLNASKGEPLSHCVKFVKNLRKYFNVFLNQGKSIDQSVIERSNVIVFLGSKVTLNDEETQLLKTGVCQRSLGLFLLYDKSNEHWISNFSQLFVTKPQSDEDRSDDDVRQKYHDVVGVTTHQLVDPRDCKIKRCNITCSHPSIHLLSNHTVPVSPLNSRTDAIENMGEPEPTDSSVMFLLKNAVTCGHRKGICNAIVRTNCKVSLPCQHNICCVMNREVYQEEPSERCGLVVCLGCVQVAYDAYIEQVSNTHLLVSLVRWAASADTHSHLDEMSNDCCECVNDSTQLCDVQYLSERLYCCFDDDLGGEMDTRTQLQPGSNDAPTHDDNGHGANVLHISEADLSERKLFVPDLSQVSHALSLYDELDVPHSPLQLIVPEFETPLVPLQPAVFGIHDHLLLSPDGSDGAGSSNCAPPDCLSVQLELHRLTQFERQVATLSTQLSALSISPGESPAEYLERVFAPVVVGHLPRSQPQLRDARHMLVSVIEHLIGLKS